MTIFKIDIITPQGLLYQGQGNQVNVPTPEGRMEILDRHIPIVSLLEKGTIEIHDLNNKICLFHAERGYISMLDNKCTISGHILPMRN